MSADCLFCRIISGTLPAERIYEDEHCLVIPDKFPKARHHYLLLPKQHLSSLMAAKPDHQMLLGHLLVQLPILAEKLKLTKGFKTLINTGAAGGQEIFHLHIHMLADTPQGG